MFIILAMKGCGNLKQIKRGRERKSLESPELEYIFSVNEIDVLIFSINVSMCIQFLKMSEYLNYDKLF